MTSNIENNAKFEFQGAFLNKYLFVYKKFWEELIAYFPWYDTGHIENDAPNNSSVVACLFVTTVTFLQSRCLATKEEFLPSRYLAIKVYFYRAVA
jgi:hypothetical protein